MPNELGVASLAETTQFQRLLLSGESSPRFRLPRYHRSVKPRARPARSILFHLVALVAAVGLPLIVIGAGALWIQYQAQRSQAEAQIVDRAKLLARLVDARLSRIEQVARTIAQSAAQGNAADLQAEIEHVNAALEVDLVGSRGPEIVITDPQGAALFDSVAPGRRDYRALPEIKAAIAARQAGMLDLLVDRQTGDTVIAVVEPVPEAASGSPIGAVVVLPSRSGLTDIIADVGMDALVFVQDRHGIIVARSSTEADAIDKLPMPAAPIADASGFARSASLGLKQVPSVLAFAHAPKTGFIVSLDVPQPLFDANSQALLRRCALVALLSLMILAAGVALAWLLMRRIAGAFQRTLPADRVSAPPVTSTTGLREADHLAACIQTLLLNRESFANDLSKADATIRTLFETSPVGVVISERTGGIVSANDAFLAMVGRTRDELDHGSIRWNVMTPREYLRADATAISEALARGSCRAYEKEFLRPDGTRIPVMISFGLIDQDDGSMAAFVMDQRERRASADALRETQERYRALASASKEGVVISENGRIVEVNDAFWQMFGYASREQVVGLEWQAMVAPQARAEVAASISRSVALPYEAIGLRANGEIFPAEFQGYPIQYKGRVMWAGLTRDLTRQKLAEAAKRESEARFRTLADAMPQMVWSAHPNGHHDYANARLYSFTGAPDGALTGTGWLPHVHPEDTQALVNSWQHSLVTGEAYEAECRMRRRDGADRWILVRAMPMLDTANGTILRWFGTNTDITDIVDARDVLLRSRRELERLVDERTRVLNDTERRLAHAERLNALGQLAGGIAHDFNNVLQSVQGGASLIQRSYANPSEVRRLSGMIMQAAERGAAITHRMLAFSRQSDLEAEAVDVVPLLTNLKELLVHSLGTGIDVRLAIATATPHLLADRRQLETVLVNLATNARDAMDGLGTLTFAAGCDEVALADDPASRPLALHPGRYITLAVTDSGCGMDAATLSRVTQPFFTTKPPGQGTGLGLAMARGFSEQSGGGIHIQSAPGHGSTITLYFPVASHEVLPVAAIEAGAAMLRDRHVRAVFVDDDALVRHVLEAELRNAGLDVRSFATAAEALCHFDNGEAVDILVSDLSMPVIDGLTLIQEAKRRRPGLPAILLTGFTTNLANIAIDGALNSGFSLLRKPVTGHMLVVRVAALLEDVAVH